ncbi:MAG: TRAP transporter substrate-binding protein [Hyphomicrobiaceae bacterium]|nr:TRAP transporter substrate-binding protein [Hyphomicrobiaceae bacterium]
MPPTTVRMGGYQAETSILTRALRRLAASLTAAPGADWQVEVIRDVTERGARAADLLAMVERGDVELCYFAASYLAGRVPSLGQFDEPFPVADRARLYADLDGERGARLAGDLEGLTGYKLLGFWDNGLRHISNRLRPIRHPDDCRGMRIRTLDNAMYSRVLAAVGFTPVVIDVKDLARAVETHAVDAQENPLTNTVNFRLHKTHKHLSLTSHFHGVSLLLANRAWFEGLSPALQAALPSAAADATAVQRQWAIDEDALCLQRLQAEGVTIVPAEEIDFAAFRAATGRTTR